MTQIVDQGRPSVWASHRRSIRYLAAALSIACAVVYLLIGLGVIAVVGAVPADAPSLLFFGVPAGLAYALGAVLLISVDRRRLWLLGALFQAFALFAYVSVADQRDPPHEMWGILLKVAQVAILGALAYLATQPRSSAEPGVGVVRSPGR